MVLENTPLDDDDMFYASYNVLKPCPFCGSNSVLPMVSHNPDTGIYRGIVECRCGASTASNQRSKSEARAYAITKWERRAK